MRLSYFIAAVLSLIVPDAASLAGMLTHPDKGGPWVMWRDTPYAHIMVPVGEM